MSDQPFDEGGFTDAAEFKRRIELSWLLRRAGEEWGPLGVAKVAAQLAGHEVVPVPVLPATCRGPEPWVDPWTEQRADGRETDRSWLSFERPFAQACIVATVALVILAVGFVAAFLLVAIL